MVVDLAVTRQLYGSVLLVVTVVVVVAGYTRSGDNVTQQVVIGTTVVDAGLVIYVSPRTVRDTNLAGNQSLHQASMTQNGTELSPYANGIAVSDALSLSVGSVQEYGVLVSLTQPRTVVEYGVTTTDVVRVEQQERILTLLTVDVVVLEGGLVRTSAYQILRVRLEVVVNQTEGVEQVSLGLAAQLELTTGGLHGVSFGISDESGMVHVLGLLVAFRRYKIGKVYRGERAQRGRFREFYQADIDVIGDSKLDISNEAEIPSIIYRAFTALGLKRFQIRVNNRKILNGFYAMLGLTERSNDIMRTVDKLDKIGAEKVKDLLMGEEMGLSEEQSDEIMTFIAITGSNTEVLTALEGYRGRHELFDLGLDELNTVVKYLAAFGVPESHFAVDLTIARGLDYYTGTVYETTMLDHPEIGSICSGGRYDNLAEYYTDKQLPGVGISIGLTRLFYVLGEQGLLNDELNTAPCDVLVLPMTENTGAVIATATAFREAGLRVQLYSEQKKFKQKMNYADKLGVPFVLILGDDEISAGTVGCKNMVSGEQITVSSADAIAHIKAALAEREKGAIILEK